QWLGSRFRRVAAIVRHGDIATTITERCNDLKSVSVHHVRLDDFNGAREFDVAVAVVDEQDAEDVISGVIRCAVRALKKTGILVLGIEAGEAPARLRDAAVEQLRSKGFTRFRCFYPFPNVLAPRVIFSERAVHAGRKSFGYWAAAAFEGNSDGFDEFQI